MTDSDTTARTCPNCGHKLPVDKELTEVTQKLKSATEELNNALKAQKQMVDYMAQTFAALLIDGPNLPTIVGHSRN